MFGICRVGLQDPGLIQVSLRPWLGSEAVGPWWWWWTATGYKMGMGMDALVGSGGDSVCVGGLLRASIDFP